MEIPEKTSHPELKSSFELIQLTREQADFRPALGRFSRETIHPDIDSVYHLANQANLAFSLDGIRNLNTEMGKRINKASMDSGANIPLTLLDRKDISPKYEIEKLNIWLGEKGLKAKPTEFPIEYEWGRSRFELGKKVSKDTLALVDSRTMTAGAVLETYDYLKTTLAEMATRTSNETDQKVLMAAEAACFVLAEELRACARGETLPPEFYLAALEEPMGGIKINLERSAK